MQIYLIATASCLKHTNLLLFEPRWYYFAVHYHFIPLFAVHIWPYNEYNISWPLTADKIASILIAFGSKNPIQPQRNRCKYKASREDKSSPSNDDRYPITQHTHWGSWTQNTHHTVSMSDVKRTTANSILNPCARPMDECGAPYEAAGALCIVECFRCMMFSLMLATQWFSLMRFACVEAAALRRYAMVAVGWRNVVQCIRIALSGVHVLGFCFRFIFFLQFVLVRMWCVWFWNYIFLSMQSRVEQSTSRSRKESQRLCNEQIEIPMNFSIIHAIPTDLDIDSRLSAVPHITIHPCGRKNAGGSNGEPVRPQGTVRHSLRVTTDFRVTLKRERTHKHFLLPSCIAEKGTVLFGKRSTALSTFPNIAHGHVYRCFVLHIWNGGWAEHAAQYNFCMSIRSTLYVYMACRYEYKMYSSTFICCWKCNIFLALMSILSSSAFEKDELSHALTTIHAHTHITQQYILSSSHPHMNTIHTLAQPSARSLSQSQRTDETRDTRIVGIRHIS